MRPERAFPGGKAMIPISKEKNQKEQEAMGIYVQVSTTVDAEADAAKIAGALVEKRLAGCVQITPITSIYRWQGKIETAGEWRLCIKTRENLCKEVEQAIAALSSYSVPEVIVTPILGGSKAYLDWLEGEILKK